MGAVFALGVGLRLLFMVGYRPAFLGDADAGSYIDAAHHGLFSNIYDPAGYPLLIRAVHFIDPHLSLLILIQHGLGITTAALLFAAVLQVTGSRLAALVPAAVVLLDGYGLWVEHTPITESLFTLLVVASVSLALRAVTKSRWLLAGVGALCACAALVRPVGLVLVVLIAVWIYFTREGSRGSRALAAGALVLPACLLVGLYIVVQRDQTGFTGITRDSGRIIYARAATFADCSQFTPPPGTRALCEQTPARERGSFNQYLTGFPDHASAVSPAGRSISPAWRVFGPPPAGNGRLAAFGRAAILHQPLDYLSAVVNDFHYFWADDHRAFIEAAARVDPEVERTVTSYYATGPGVHSTSLGFLRWYGETIEVSGGLMILLLLAPLAALLSEEPRARRAAALLALAGWLLPLASDAAASVDPRFVLPAYGPLAAAAAIGGHGARARWRSRRAA